jgi:transcriptional regulator of nitric oxide reductase
VAGRNGFIPSAVRALLQASDRRKVRLGSGDDCVHTSGFVFGGIYDVFRFSVEKKINIFSLQISKEKTSSVF